MVTMRQGEIVSGLVLAGLGLFIVAQSSQWVLLGKEGPGPGFFPLIYGVLMVLLSLALITQAILKRPSVSSVPGNGINNNVMAALGVWLAFLATILSMKAIGFMVALGLLVVFMTRIIYSKSLQFSLVSGLTVPLGFYLIFKLGLQVQLPVGTWTGI